jgi:peroxiredoxin Q/BCP
VVAEGTPAPDFELPSDSGKPVRLASFRGRLVVLYFYPKDDTPGCTKEACEFRDAYDEFRARGVEVIGISPDTGASHERFKERHGLPFTLLADSDHVVAEQYGVWVERSMYGRKFMGIRRSTFVIDADGRVAKSMLGIRPAGHAAKVLEALPPT